MSESMRERVALAIGAACTGGQEVAPRGNWLKAADAAIAAYHEGQREERDAFMAWFEGLPTEPTPALREMFRKHRKHPPNEAGQ